MSESSNRLKNFPVSGFSIVMGMAGFSIAWNRAEHVFDPGCCLSSMLLAITTILFVVMAVIYVLKAIKYPGDVMGEIRHPIKLAFIPGISISMLLLSIAYLHLQPALSFWFWTIGTVLHLGITLYVLSSWIHHTKYEIAHMNPAWFIPVVGNILIPIAGVHHAPTDVSWFFFSIGLFFWPILTAIIFNRLIFHGSLPDRFMPTLFIFIAPPAVGFISWFNLVGEVDAFARVLYFTGLIFTLLLFTQLRYFTRLKFFLSWWAYSFPIAAITIATLLMAKETGVAFYNWLAAGLLGLLSLVIALLVWRTMLAVTRKEICVEGH